MLACARRIPIGLTEAGVEAPFPMTVSQPIAIVRIDAELGEGPAWDIARQCLWFVDIKQHLLYRFDPASGALQSWKAPDQIGWALPAVDGSLLTGVRGGLFRFEPSTGQFPISCAPSFRSFLCRMPSASTNSVG